MALSGGLAARRCSPLLLLPILVGSTASEQDQEADLFKVDLKTFPDARCLDGTAGAYYYRRAANVETRRWVIMLEGGGECVSNNTCYLKWRFTGLGSSSHYTPTQKLWGMQDPNTKENPDFAEWHQVFVKYCSQDLHLGTMTTSDPKQWGWVRFSGAHIVNAVLESLATDRGLADAETIVWSGKSAGGIGSVAHLDAVAERFPNARVVGAPIAGYYWDNSAPYRGPGATAYIPFGVAAFKQYESLWKMWVPQRCAGGPHAAEPWTCALAYYSFPTLVTPIFVIEALVDSVQLQLHSGVASCGASEELASYCAAWGANMTYALAQVARRARANASAAGLFAPACYLHTEFRFRAPTIGGRGYLQAFGDWLLRSGGKGGSVSEDSCCEAAAVVYNPTCPKQKAPILV